MLRSIPICILLALLSLISPAVAAELRLPGGVPLERSQGIDPSVELQTIAFGDDGALAFAIPREHNGRIGSTVEIRDRGMDGTRIDLDLRLRDLIWLSDGRLLGIGFRAARRTQGESFLLIWDPARDRFKRLMRLPPTASDLAYGNHPDLLLLTARDELRTIRLPLLRSGPLFRVLGDNHSVAVLKGNRVLVGQSEALLLVDLDDRQSREEMPVRERVSVSSPVEQLAAAADGNGALVGLLDGRVQRVLLEPLRLVDDGQGKLVSAAPGSVSRANPSPPMTPPSVPTTHERRAAPSSVAERPPVPAREAPAVIADAPKPVDDRPLQPVKQEPVVERGPSKPTERPIIELQSPSTPEHASIHGRLTGPGASAVLAVVAFGPDSLLREAARIVPQADGIFNFDTLPAGRYRVQLDGGGGKVLVSDPAFHIVDVKADASLDIQFRIQRTL